MKKKRQQIDIEIDKLTRSIENSITGDSFFTEIIVLEKSDLIEHYEKILGAEHIGEQLMIINTFSAHKLIDIYFKE